MASVMLLWLSLIVLVDITKMSMQMAEFASVSVSVSEEVTAGSWCLVLQSSDNTHTVFILQKYLSLLYRGDGYII